MTQGDVDDDHSGMFVYLLEIHNECTGVELTRPKLTKVKTVSSLAFVENHHHSIVWPKIGQYLNI